MLKKAKLFIKFIGPDVTKYSLLLVFLGVLYFVVETGFAYIIQYFLVSLGIMDGSNLPLKFKVPDGPVVLLALIFLGGLKSFCYYLRLHVSYIIQQYFVELQRRNIFEKSLRSTSLQFSLSEITSNFSDVVTQAGQLVYFLSSFIVTTIATLLLFFYGLYLAPFEMLIAGASLTILVVPLKMLSQRIYQAGREILKEWSQTNNFLVTGIRNNFYLKISGAIESQIKLGHASLATYRKHGTSFSRHQSLLTVTPLFIGITVVALVTFLSWKYIKTPGIVLLSFFYLFMRMSQMASETMNTVAQLRLNSQYFKRLYHLNLALEENGAGDSKAEREELQLGLASIALENVSFNYGKSEPLFSAVNLSLNRNDTLVIKGESGAGKSTLLSILLGLKTPTSGRIAFNNKFQAISPQLISYVGPEPYLIPSSIRENLIFANTRVIEDAEIWNVLRKVKLEEKIKLLAHELDEVMSDDIPLSTGEKQRLAIARAFLRKSELFVLDEATANLDAETEAFILEEFKIRFAGHIAVIVTHKDSFDKMGTKILNLTGRKVSKFNEIGFS